MKQYTNPTHREIFSESCSTKLNLDCNYTFHIDLAPNRIPFNAKSIGKVYLQSNLQLIQHDSEKISRCVFLYIYGRPTFRPTSFRPKIFVQS